VYHRQSRHRVGLAIPSYSWYSHIYDPEKFPCYRCFNWLNRRNCRIYRFGINRINRLGPFCCRLCFYLWWCYCCLSYLCRISIGERLMLDLVVLAKVERWLVKGWRLMVTGEWLLLGLIRLVVGLAGGEVFWLLVSPSLLEVWFWWACSGFWFLLVKGFFWQKEKKALGFCSWWRVFCERFQGYRWTAK